MKIALLQTGKTTEKYINEGVEIYSARIRKYAVFNIITIPDLKDTRNMPAEVQRKKEGSKIAGAIGQDDYVILLDERGKEFRTIEFAGLMEKLSMIPGKRIVFVIGGPWGFSEETLSLADFRLSLSKMTLPHQMVRLFFVEQLYRALSIIKGEPYHHE